VSASDSLPASVPAADVAAAPDAYKVALDKLVQIAFEAGQRQERARVAAILATPSAATFPHLTIDLVASDLSPEKAAAALHAAADAHIRLMAQSFAPASELIH